MNELYSLLDSFPNLFSLSYEERVSFLRIALTEGIGFVRFFGLMKRFGNLEAIVEHLETKERNNGIVRILDRVTVENIYNRSFKLKARILLLPEILLLTPILYLGDSPPLFLIAKGNLDLLKKFSISIVGARDATRYNGEFAALLADEVVKGDDYVVTSGLARGIDTAAHCGAFPNTIAVIGNGIDYPYPEENRQLYSKIANEGGLLLTEYPFGEPPLPSHFFQRNRIIAYLSIATVVIEAARRSGSIITAEFALNAGREVCACPGLPDHSRYFGNNKLIQDGAYLLYKATNLKEHLEGTRAKFSQILSEFSVANYKSSRLL